MIYKYPGRLYFTLLSEKRNRKNCLLLECLKEKEMDKSEVTGKATEL